MRLKAGDMLYSDGLILVATIYAAREGGAASLESVIHTVDYFDRIVLTFEEMEGALARLTAAGYLTFANGKLAPTERSLALYRRIEYPGRSFLDEVHDIAKLIGAAVWKPGTDPRSANVGASFPALSRAEFDTAVDSYRANFAKALAALNER